MALANYDGYKEYIVKYYRLKWNNDELTMRDILVSFYVDDDISIRKLAKKFKISVSTLQQWLEDDYVHKRPCIVAKVR